MFPKGVLQERPSFYTGFQFLASKKQLMQCGSGDYLRDSIRLFAMHTVTIINRNTITRHVIADMFPVSRCLFFQARIHNLVQTIHNHISEIRSCIINNSNMDVWRVRKDKYVEIR